MAMAENNVQVGYVQLFHVIRCNLEIRVVLRSHQGMKHES